MILTPQSPRPWLYRQAKSDMLTSIQSLNKGSIVCFFLLECIPMSTFIELFLAERQYLRSGIHGKSHYLAPVLAFFNT